jgi:PD-(D/E)XK nuclease superfamily
LVLDNLSTEPPISPLTAALGDFSDALISREWRHIDLMIESKNNNLVFAIENKIESSEGKEQLSRHGEIVGGQFPNYRKLFSYLTKTGEAASNDLWSPISYSDVIDALQEAQARQSSNLTDEAKLIISHYVNLIRRNIVPDQELIDQCRKLYALHKDALDLIIRYGNVNAFVSAADLFFKSHTELKPLIIRSGQAAFLPASLFEIVPQIDGTNLLGQSRPFAFWFNLEGDNRFGLVLEVGPFAGEKFNRELLVRELLDYFKSKKQITQKYTRVYSEYIKFTDDQIGNSEEIQTAMNSLYEKVASRHLSSVKDISQRFFQK